MKLNVEGGYPEVNALYMGARMINGPNYPDMDNNCDRNKYNYYLLGNLPL